METGQTEMEAYLAARVVALTKVVEEQQGMIADLQSDLERAATWVDRQGRE